jgi:hypothetical protein
MILGRNSWMKDADAAFMPDVSRTSLLCRTSHLPGCLSPAPAQRCSPLLYPENTPHALL